MTVSSASASGCSADGRRREMTSHGRPSSPSAAAATRASRLVDASSSQCASSTTTTSGPVMHRARRRTSASAWRSGRKRGSSSSTSGVEGTSRWATSAISGATGRRPGSTCRKRSRSSLAIAAGSPRRTPSRSRTVSRRARSGKVTPYDSPRTVIVLTRPGPSDARRVRAEHLGHEPALAHPGLALDDDRAAATGDHLVEVVAQRLLLGEPADEGEHAVLRRSLVADLGTHRDRLEGCRLALDVEGREGRGREGRVRSLEHRGAGVDRAGRCGRHQPGRGVHGVAHDRERRAVGHADLADEDVAPVDPHLDRQRQAAVGDPAKAADHPSLVVGPGGRQPGGQHHLAAVLVDVGGEEGDLVGRRRVLHRGDDLVERVGHGVGSLGGHRARRRR